ncbi:hypothetical protein FOA52_004017 [Chlamydomonas sp. UWO 241]|nr:hypothetical protein FOA52_004017 [Chlamydomonas sp. UWO 241]
MRSVESERAGAPPSQAAFPWGLVATSLRSLGTFAAHLGATWEQAPLQPGGAWQARGSLSNGAGGGGTGGGGVVGLGTRSAGPARPVFRHRDAPPSGDGSRGGSSPSDSACSSSGGGDSVGAAWPWDHHRAAALAALPVGARAGLAHLLGAPPAPRSLTATGSGAPVAAASLQSANASAGASGTAGPSGRGGARSTDVDNNNSSGNTNNANNANSASNAATTNALNSSTTGALALPSGWQRPPPAPLLLAVAPSLAGSRLATTLSSASTASVPAMAAPFASSPSDAAADAHSPAAAAAAVGGPSPGGSHMLAWRAAGASGGGGCGGSGAASDAVAGAGREGLRALLQELLALRRERHTAADELATLQDANGRLTDQLRRAKQQQQQAQQQQQQQQQQQEQQEQQQAQQQQVPLAEPLNAAVVAGEDSCAPPPPHAPHHAGVDGDVLGDAVTSQLEVLLREKARLAESNASLVSENVGLQMLLQELTLLLSGQDWVPEPATWAHPAITSYQVDCSDDGGDDDECEADGSLWGSPTAGAGDGGGAAAQLKPSLVPHDTQSRVVDFAV